MSIKNKESNNMLNKDFQEITKNIKNMVSSTQLEIMIDANSKLVKLYYNIGKMISENYEWGNKFVDNLAMELKLSFPNLKGFSARNLNYMKSFYDEYKDDNEFVHLGAKLPWKHNLDLIQKVKDKEVRKWYMERCIEEGWSKSVLEYQIETDLYSRQVKSNKHNNFNLTINQDSDLANNMMKEPYIFDLMNLSKKYKEHDLENKMVERLKNVLLELGNGFSFVGNQYKITIDDQDFYIDLLFYHIKLKCYIAVELKARKFIPEFASKMGFYLTALDEEIKDKNDNPSIGLILCKNKNNKIVDYSLRYINKPIGVSEYKTIDRLSKNILKELPTEEEINLHINIDE